MKNIITAVFILAAIGIACILAATCSAVAYICLALITGSPFIDYSLPIVVFAAACYGVLRYMTSFGPLKGHLRAALPISLVAALAAASLAAYPTIREITRHYPDHAGQEVLQALQVKAVQLKSLDAGEGLEDLQPLKPILYGKRIIALGEATHGTSEFFRMKHRLLVFFVTELGFRHFGMELSPQDGRILNDYIQGRPADPKKVLYWPWATQEVMDMLDWMRAYNAGVDPKQRITFHGIDPTVGERDPVMAQNVTSILQESGLDSKIVLWAHNAHISNGSGWMGSYLKQKWGNQAYLLGFEFDHGAFTSRMATVQTYSVGPASSDYYAYSLAKLNLPLLYLDFQTLSQAPALRGWLETPQSSHEFQELHAIFRLNPDWVTLHTSWTQLYDGLIYIEESTPAKSIRK